MIVKYRHNLFLAGILLALFFVFGSCQNRNQVTHNKRKYRKGYYKPNRAKVKHKKSIKEEEYAYESRSQRKQSHEKKKTSQSKENEKVIEGGEVRNFEEESASPSNNVSSSQDHVADKTKVEQESQETAHYKNEKIKEPEQKRKLKRPKKIKTNWVFWLSFVFYFIGFALVLFAAFLMGTWGGFFLLFAFFSIAIFLLSFNIRNLKVYEKSEENKFLRGASIFFIVLLSLAILLVVGVVFAVLFQ